MRVLITGGAGFIGSTLVRACVEAGDSVRVLDDFSTGSQDNLASLEGDIEIVSGSIEDLDTVRTAVAGREVVYHQAALGSVPRSIEDPLHTHHINATGSLIVLDAARNAGAQRFVFAASSSAYGDTETLPKVETMAPRPLSPYALQKRMGESYCEIFHRLYGLETMALRYFNIFGPRQSSRSAYAAVIPRFIAAAVAGKRPTIYGDGQQTRDFTFVADAVGANRAAACASPEAAGKVYNVACGGEISLLQLLETIWEALRERGAVQGPMLEPEFLPARSGDVRHSRADISRARELLAWEPLVGLKEGVAATVDWFLREQTP